MISVERFPALHGNLFQSPHDHGILEGAIQLFSFMWEDPPKIERVEPTFVPISEEELAQILTRGIRAYAGATVSFASVRPTDLKLLPRSLERFKLFRLAQLDDLRLRYKLPPAARIVGSPWPIVPPIVEKSSDGSLVVIDGAHRVYSAETRGDRAIDVLLVSTVDEPLPARPQIDSDRIGLSFERLPRSERYDELRPEYFRPIRAAFQRF